MLQPNSFMLCTFATAEFDFKPRTELKNLMSNIFDRKLARLLLEICRFTYADGAGGERNKKDRDNSLNYIESHSPATVTGKLLDTSSIFGVGLGSTSKACVVSFADRNVVSYMGTEAEFDIHDPQ